jgi:Protein of unknown function (DUF3592)
MKIAATWLSLFIACAVVIGLLAGMPGLLSLARKSRTTTGRVVKTEPRNHFSVTVQYEIDGVSFVRNFEVSNLKAGETTTVFYSPTDPGTSSIEEPVGLLKSQLPFYYGASLLFSVAFTYAVFDIKKRIRKIGG